MALRQGRQRLPSLPHGRGCQYMPTSSLPLALDWPRTNRVGRPDPSVRRRLPWPSHRPLRIRQCLFFSCRSCRPNRRQGQKVLRQSRSAASPPVGGGSWSRMPWDLDRCSNCLRGRLRSRQNRAKQDARPGRATPAPWTNGRGCTRPEDRAHRQHPAAHRAAHGPRLRTVATPQVQTEARRQPHSLRLEWSLPDTRRSL